MKYYYSKSRKKPNVRMAIEGYRNFYAQNWRRFFLSSGNLQKNPNPISLCASCRRKVEKKVEEKSGVWALNSTTKHAAKNGTGIVGQKQQKNNIATEQNQIWKAVSKEVPTKDQIRTILYSHDVFSSRPETKKGKKIESNSLIIKDIKRKKGTGKGPKYCDLTTGKITIEKNILRKDGILKRVREEVTLRAKKTNERRNEDKANTTKNVEKKDGIYKPIHPKEETAQTNLHKGCVKGEGWGGWPTITSNKQTNRNVANPLAVRPLVFFSKLSEKEPKVEHIIRITRQNEKIKTSKNPYPSFITHRKQKIVFPKIASAAAGIL